MFVLPNQGGPDSLSDVDGKTSGEFTITPKGRRKIRRILQVQQLAKETQEALREEEERRKRLAERDRQQQQEGESREHGQDDTEVR